MKSGINKFIVVTLSAMALSALFLGENYSPFAIASLVLMLAGIMLVQPPLKGKTITLGLAQK